MKAFLLISLLAGILVFSNSFAQSKRIEHNGQKVFLSGMNLAWIDFVKYITHFQEYAAPVTKKIYKQYKKDILMVYPANY